MFVWVLAGFLPVAWLVAFLFAWSVGYEAGVDAWMITFLIFGLSGALIVVKRRGQVIGWLLYSIGLITTVGAFLSTLAYRWLDQGRIDAAAWSDAVGNCLLTALIPVIPAILILFPDGTSMSRRWRWLLALVVFTSLLGGSAALLNGGWGGDIRQSVIVSPLRAETAPLGDVLSQVFFLGLAASVVGGAVAALVRFRRSRGLERQQIKWLAAAACMGAVSMAMVGFDTNSAWEIVLVAAAFSAVPVAICIAILRFKLYEIDRLVSRTLTYGLVAAVLSAVYAGGLIGILSLIPDAGDLAISASTLAAVALFAPLKRRVQDVVDRRFNRRRYDTRKVIEAFTVRLRDGFDLDSVTKDLQAVVSETLEPVSTSIWVTQPRR